ncbi:MAG: helix-turn-helix domain-containing protein [Kiritimatiellae bacterium]|nr:helix-turn-helix domain-containing protein [Kiritimatiellia bacterium]
MIEFGETLRKAREAKGFTAAQLAQKTHMMGQQIEALENEDFSRIAAPIYGRGFVKLYCEAVGLDSRTMVAEFMDIYSGNREPTIRMRTPKHTPEPQPEPDTAQTPADSDNAQDAVLTGTPEPERIASEDGAESAPETQSQSWPGERQPADFSLEAETVPAPKVASRFAPPERSLPEPDDIERALMMARLKRIVLLAGAAILVLWLVIAGCRSVFSSIEGNGEVEKPAEPQAEEQESSAPAEAAAPAAQNPGMRVTTATGKHLYID